jgi:hypothetical protein
VVVVVACEVDEDDDVAGPSDGALRSVWPPARAEPSVRVHPPASAAITTAPARSDRHLERGVDTASTLADDPADPVTALSP